MLTVGTAILILAVVLQACLFHFVFWLRIRPLVVVAEQTRHTSPPAKKFYASDIYGLLAFFLLVPAIGAGWFVLIRALAANHPRSGNTLIAIDPEFAVWMLPALFLAIIGMALPADLIGRCVWRDRYEVQMLSSLRRNQLPRYSPRLLPWLNALMAILSITIIVLASDWYARFEQDSMVFNPLLEIGERTYQYSDVAEIATVARFRAPNGSIKSKAHIALRFNDGWWWTSRDGLRSSKAVEDQAVLELIKSKTGLSVAEYELLP